MIKFPVITEADPKCPRVPLPDAIFVFLLPGLIYFINAGGLHPACSGDIATHFMIYLGRLRKAFFSGAFPFWEPLWAGGYPFAADPQTMCYYPPAWLAAVLLCTFGMTP